ncbi:MAG: PLP-dependent aminotransferase family protein [Acholeplasmataceae bacterium]
MITVYLDPNCDEPIYMQIYTHIKRSIERGELKAHERLPSKRKFAKHLEVSVMTVETSYQQLILEGYVYAREKKGYFVEDYHSLKAHSARKAFDEGKRRTKDERTYRFSFDTNVVDTTKFPHHTWAKLARLVLSENHHEMLNVTHPQGLLDLRVEIRKYLAQYRGIHVSEKQVVIGSGTESLIGAIIQMIGRNRRYGVEDPGYGKIRSIYAASGVELRLMSLDDKGVRVDDSRQQAIDVMHITPSHQFPLGIVMPVRRRIELLNWASQEENRYIIEDDYDSEFRFQGKPIPALMGLDRNEKTIYMNTFTKSLAPSFRISYLVLPEHLMEAYDQISSYLGCSVPNFEQYILYEFMAGGYFERHINRMRNAYKAKRDALIARLNRAGRSDLIRIKGADAGLHFLLEIHNGMSEAELVARAKERGIRVSGLGSYYGRSKNDHSALVIGYSGLREKEIEVAVDELIEAWELERP